MTVKTNRLLVIIDTALVVLMVGGGAVAKIFKAQAMVADFTRLGIAPYTQLLGLLELIFLMLLLYPKTIRVGYILLFSYYAGAIATHLAHGEINFMPVLPMVLITLSALLRDRSFLLHANNKFIN
jgi:hypothetical protein